jgi:hypothetical protein
VCATSAFEFFFLVPLETGFRVHVDAMNFRSYFHEGKIEAVAVVGGHDRRLGVSDMLEPFTYHRSLVGNIERSSPMRWNDSPRLVH